MRLKIRSLPTIKGDLITVFLFLVSICSFLIFFGPFLTNGGPVHMSFARMFWFGQFGPLQNAMYQIHYFLDPNLLIYILSGPLMYLTNFDFAESFLQIICTFGMPLAGLVVMRAVGSTAITSTNILVSLSLHQMFFLGLYNYSISIAIALLALATTVYALRDGGLWWLGLSITLGPVSI